MGLYCWPEGDAYFGALLNSLIHVKMYSYYTLSLLKISCPWKKYLTMAQLFQFTTVVIYSVFSFFSAKNCGLEASYGVVLPMLRNDQPIRSLLLILQEQVFRKR